MKLINKIKKKIKIFVFIILIINMSIIIGRYLNNRLVKYSKQKAINNAMENINKIISDEFIETLDFTNIIDENKTYINTVKINKIVKEANNELNKNVNVNQIEKLFIPFKIIFSDAIYDDSSLGFFIRSVPISSYETDIHANVEDFGMNNSVISIYLDVKINVEILFPLNNLTEEVNTKILLTMIIIEGKVPNGIIYSN